MTKRKTQDEYVAEVAILNENIEVIGEYINAQTKILHKCKLDNCEWEVSPNNILRGKGCPYCSGLSAISGVNDLQTLCPNLMEEWDWQKNNQMHLNPSQLKMQSNKKAWWICRYGHEWFASISSRNTGVGCPICAKENQVSHAEMTMYFYLKKYFKDAVLGYNDKQNKLSELDVYIPSIHYGFEYDGEKWHLDTDKDKNKDKVCDSLGIRLIRVREPNCPIYESDSCTFIYLKDLKENTLATIITSILELLGVKNPNVNCKADAAEIEDLINHRRKINSLADMFPEVASQWHPTKNGQLTPYGVSGHSGKTVWWFCQQCGHEWMAKISSRSDGCGCPKCAKEKSIKAVIKPVYCVELNQVFSSMSDASKQMDINIEGIYVCCRGKRKSAGKHPDTGEKLHWYYVEDQLQQDGTLIEGAISFGYISAEDVRDFLQNTT